MRNGGILPMTGHSGRGVATSSLAVLYPAKCWFRIHIHSGPILCHFPAINSSAFINSFPYLTQEISPCQSSHPSSQVFPAPFPSSMRHPPPFAPAGGCSLMKDAIFSGEIPSPASRRIFVPDLIWERFPTEIP